jgi:hypothetical protein
MTWLGSDPMPGTPPNSATDSWNSEKMTAIVNAILPPNPMPQPAGRPSSASSSGAGEISPFWAGCVAADVFDMWQLFLDDAKRSAGSARGADPAVAR